MASPQHALYVPRVAIDWLTQHPDERTLEFEGSVLFADISGFTALSERLMKEMGERGAEVVTRVMNEAFSELVEIVLLEHGDLLRFGGDAVLVMFTGEHHVGRACRAALDMREAVATVDTPGEPLGISIGVSSGSIVMDRVGTASQELIASGPTIDRALIAESAADTGQIGIDAQTADVIPVEVVDRQPEKILLVSDPDIAPLLDDLAIVRLTDDVDVGVFISPDLRDQLTLTLQEGQHRTATIGFIKVSGLSTLDTAERVEALTHLFASIIDRCGANAVSYLGSDVDKDGAKFILAAGVPNRVRTKDGLAAALFEIVEAETVLSISGGSAYGAVFAGDLGAPGRRCYTVMADTVNLAARLAAAAGNGEVWTTAAALDRTAGVFETTKLEPIDLKGKSMQVTPIRLGALTSHTDDVSLGEELFGRRAEIASISRIVEDGLNNNGAVLVLTGPDGMGKGSIAAAATRGRAPIDNRFRCTDRWEGIHGIARRLMQLIVGTDALRTEAALQEAVARIDPTLTDWLPLLGDVVGFDLPPTEATASLAPEVYLRRLHEAVVRLVTISIGDRRAVLRVEDATLADETSVGLLELLADAVHGHPWVMLITATDVPHWVAADASVVRVDRLDVDRSRQFVLESLGDAALPAPVIDEIVDRAVGSPGVLRELTLCALEGGAVPETIEAAALARIDRLDSRDRQLLSYASVLGMDARIDLLAALLPEMSAALEDPESWGRLEDFVDTEIVGRIRFRDATQRDVVYQILPHERRVRVHAAAGGAIEKQARRRPERFVAELAYHFHEAGDWDRSWKYNRLAAERALQGQAPLRAVRNLERALEAAEQLGIDASERAVTSERLGDAFERAGMFDRAVEAYASAGDLVDGGEERWRPRVLAARAMIRLGQHDEAREILDRALDATTLSSVRAEALTALAGMEVRKGHFDDAASLCDAVFVEPDAHPTSIARAHYIRSLASAHNGWSDATEHAKKSKEIYEAIGDLSGAANALNNLGFRFFYTGEWAECEDQHREALAIRAEIGDVLGRALASYNLGELMVEQGRMEEADGFLRSALADFRGAGHQVGEAATRLTLGRLAARRGDVEAAVSQFGRAEQLALVTDADEQVIDVAFGRCELAMLTMSGAGAEALASIDPTTLSPIQAARFGVLAAMTVDDSESRRLRLTDAVDAASDLGALHLLQLAVECMARLYGEGQSRAIELSDRLGIVARPVFKL